MPVSAPHSRLFTSITLEATAAKLTKSGRKSLYEGLNLVAYIDMMTMLVIFLLMSFSATGEILFVQKNIVLPEAQNWSELERAPVIAISSASRDPGRQADGHHGRAAAGRDHR